jgi:hypothetical protein
MRRGPAGRKAGRKEPVAVPLDASVVLFYASLGMSAAAVVLFLWLMREKPEGGRRKGKAETTPHT